jgi:hypothetical protein
MADQRSTGPRRMRSTNAAAYTATTQVLKAAGKKPKATAAGLTQAITLG